MANRNFYPPKGSLEIDVCSLWCEINIGAAGAVSSSSGKGVASVVKESAAGQYTITLSDHYNKLLWADVALLDDTDSDPTSVGTVARIQSEGVNSNKTVVIQAYNFTDGSDANPASGAKLLVKMELRNSSVE